MACWMRVSVPHAEMCRLHFGFRGLSVDWRIDRRQKLDFHANM